MQILTITLLTAAGFHLKFRETLKREIAQCLQTNAVPPAADQKCAPPDEMLRDAVAGDKFADLPGKGKPLNLDDYFRSGEENRMAGKILRDNKVLPPQLQERKDAEEHLKEAAEELEKATQRIEPLRQAIVPLAQLLLCALANHKDLIKTLGLDTLPDTFQPPVKMPRLYSVDLIEVADQFNSLSKRHNASVRNLTYRYVENLKIAHENIESSRKRQLLNRSLLPTYAPTAQIDIDAKAAEIQSRFALLPELPKDWKSHFKRWQQSQKPSIWKRMVHST